MWRSWWHYLLSGPCSNCAKEWDETITARPETENTGSHPMTVALVMLLKSFLFWPVAAFLLWMRRLAIRYIPDGRIKRRLLTTIWFTDWEKAANERAGIFPPVRHPTARGLAWGRAGRIAGEWLRRKLR